MEKIETVVVCLDLSEQDEALLSYACYFAKWLPSLKKIILAHNIKYNLPEELYLQLTEQSAQLTTLIADDLTEKAEIVCKQHLGRIAIEAIVTEEAATDLSLSKICHSEDVGLVLVGKKPLARGTGIVPDKLLRSLTCNVLLVPNTAYHQITNILVPVDFSKQSRMALETAIELQKPSNAPITCLHVYKTPEQYFPYISFVDGLDQQQEKQAINKLAVFLKKFGTPDIYLQKKIVAHGGGSISKKIYEQSVKEKSDLVIIGAKGNSTLSQITVGTVTASLSNMDLHFPLMVVKNN